MYESCKEIKRNLPGAGSGVYMLKAGRHFCRMGDISECGSGGWTLAMKINGTKVSSMLYTNSKLKKKLPEWMGFVRFAKLGKLKDDHGGTHIC